MSQRPILTCPRPFCGALLSAFVALASVLSAQQISFGRVKNFSVPEYFEPPNQNQIKSLLAGSEARPQADGTFLIKELKLETYRENGEREIVVMSPECVYDSARRVASSASRLQIQTGDGRFTIEGEGFLWQQTNFSLTISNRVHTIIRPELGKAAPAKS
jgi:hypothetical protein